ncbi:MAG: hypothetical protein LBM98_10665, partial [Oscillospiraceae bacterium]|nr:hypothetical protein [Oscillospiraceae bacterium]
LRYVGRIGARQSSAGSVTYVSADCGTGLLRTCNALRIAGLPVLRKDGQGKALPCPGAMRRDDGRGYVRARRGKGGFETRPYVCFIYTFQNRLLYSTIFNVNTQISTTAKIAPNGYSFAFIKS